VATAGERTQVRAPFVSPAVHATVNAAQRALMVAAFQAVRMTYRRVRCALLLAPVAARLQPEEAEAAVLADYRTSASR
jgi:hypothetical protein